MAIAELVLLEVATLAIAMTVLLEDSKLEIGEVVLLEDSKAGICSLQLQRLCGLKDQRWQLQI